MNVSNTPSVERISQHVERVSNPGGFDRIRLDGRLVGYVCEMDDLGEVLTSDSDACDLVAAVSGVIELDPDDVPGPACEDVAGSDVHYTVWYGLNCEEFSACFDTYGEAMDFAAGLLG